MIEEPFIIQDWRPAFNKWFIAPCQRELIPSFLGKGKKITLVSRMSHICLPTGICLSISQGETTAHWQIDSEAWQTSRLIHPRTKAGKYFVCGSWRSSFLLQPCRVLLLLHSWWVHICMHGHAAQHVLAGLSCTASASEGILPGLPSVLSEQRGKSRAGGETVPSEHLKTWVPLVQFGNTTWWSWECATPLSSPGASPGVCEDVQSIYMSVSPCLHNPPIPVTFSVQQCSRRFLETGSQLCEHRASVTTERLYPSLN